MCDKVASEFFRASQVVSLTRPPTALFFIRTVLFGLAAPPVPCFPPDLGLHPSGEPRPSLAPRGALGDSGQEKSRDGPALSVREHANPTFSSQIPHPHPLVALSLPAPPLANPPAGCLHSAVPPPTSLYSTIRRAICLYSTVGQLLPSRLVDTPGKCSSICLGGHGLGRRGGADVCRAF
jgi:hypothetical protein